MISPGKESKGKVHYGKNFVNTKVNEFFIDSVNDHVPTREGRDPLMKTLVDSFKWYPPNKETGSGTVTKLERDHSKTTTMWYNCNGTE